MHRHKNGGEKMPRGDRTGPWGAGPMTGRAAGYCAGYPVPGYTNPIGHERGWGRRRGRGFGRRRFVYPAPATIQPEYQPAYQPVTYQPQTPEQEIEVLENYQKNLEAEKSDIEQEVGGVKARIEELKQKIQK